MARRDFHHRLCVLDDRNWVLIDLLVIPFAFSRKHDRPEPPPLCGTRRGHPILFTPRRDPVSLKSRLTPLLNAPSIPGPPKRENRAMSFKQPRVSWTRRGLIRALEAPGKKPFQEGGDLLKCS